MDLTERIAKSLKTQERVSPCLLEEAKRNDTTLYHAYLYCSKKKVTLSFEEVLNRIRDIQKGLPPNQCAKKWGLNNRQGVWKFIERVGMHEEYIQQREKDSIHTATPGKKIKDDFLRKVHREYDGNASEAARNHPLSMHTIRAGWIRLGLERKGQTLSEYKYRKKK